MIHVGTCGFPVAKSKYFKEFNVIEIQKTFYSPLSEKTALRWRRESPDNFEFILKAIQTITHPPDSPTYRRYQGKIGDFGFFKNNNDVMNSWDKFKKIAKILKTKIIIFQTPPKFSENEENVKNIYEFFNSIEREFIFGWENRGKWNENTVQKTCEDLKIIHVVDPFKSKKLWGEFSYYRLHGIGGYRYRYSDEELQKLKNIGRKGDYFLFNNTNMWEDAIRFKSLLSVESIHNPNNQRQ